MDKKDTTICAGCFHEKENAADYPCRRCNNGDRWVLKRGSEAAEIRSLRAQVAALTSSLAEREQEIERLREERDQWIKTAIMNAAASDKAISEYERICNECKNSDNRHLVQKCATAEYHNEAWAKQMAGINEERTKERAAWEAEKAYYTTTAKSDGFREGVEAAAKLADDQIFEDHEAGCDGCDTARHLAKAIRSLIPEK